MAENIHLAPKTIYDEPGFWFAKLERAWDNRDSRAAQKAQEQLARLGWEVHRRDEREEVVPC